MTIKQFHKNISKAMEAKGFETLDAFKQLDDMQSSTYLVREDFLIFFTRDNVDNVLTLRFVKDKGSKTLSQELESVDLEAYIESL
jgi:hypothetical protein